MSREEQQSALAAVVERWRRLREECQNAGVRLLVVSKYAEDAAVAALMAAGESHFAESRPQQLRDRARQWPACHWHMIGPLQKNKAKYIARYAAAWHSCEDSGTASTVARLVKEQRSQGALPVLIQVNIAGDPRRHGVDPAKAGELFDALMGMDGVEPTGLMAMAPKLAECGVARVRETFRRLRALRDELFGEDRGELCIGMSNDYRIAIEEGATIVRLGSAIFDVSSDAAKKADLSSRG